MFSVFDPSVEDSEEYKKIHHEYKQIVSIASIYCIFSCQTLIMYYRFHIDLDPWIQHNEINTFLQVYDAFKRWINVPNKLWNSHQPWLIKPSLTLDQEYGYVLNTNLSIWKSLFKSLGTISFFFCYKLFPYASKQWLNCIINMIIGNLNDLLYYF